MKWVVKRNDNYVSYWCSIAMSSNPIPTTTDRKKAFVFSDLKEARYCCLNFGGKVYRRGKKKPMTELGVCFNNSHFTEPCNVCEIYEADAQVGPALCIKSTFKMVCHSCGQKLAPLLVKLIEASYKDTNGAADPPAAAMKNFNELFSRVNILKKINFLKEDGSVNEKFGQNEEGFISRACDDVYFPEEK